MILERLQRVSLFRSLPEAQLQRVKERCEILDQPANTTIIEEGSQGDSLYVILEGAVKVYKQDFYGGREVITTLHEGDHFGEVSLFDQAPRSAAVSTIKPSRLLSLSRDNLQEMMQEDADFAASIYENLISDLCNRLRETNEHLIYLMGKSSPGA